MRLYYILHYICCYYTINILLPLSLQGANTEDAFENKTKENQT